MSRSSNVLAATVLVLSVMLTGCGPASSGAIATAPTPVTVSHPIERKVRENFDLPVILGITVFATICIIIFNLIVDIVYAWFDPRIRLS